MNTDERALRQHVREQMDVALKALTVLGQAIYHRVDIDVEAREVIPKSYGTDPADVLRALFCEEVPHSDAVPYAIDHILTAGQPVV